MTDFDVNGPVTDSMPASALRKMAWNIARSMSAAFDALDMADERAAQAEAERRDMAERFDSVSRANTALEIERDAALHDLETVRIELQEARGEAAPANPGTRRITAAMRLEMRRAEARLRAERSTTDVDATVPASPKKRKAKR